MNHTPPLPKLTLRNETVMSLDGMKHGQFSLVLPDGRKIAVIGDLKKEWAERIVTACNAHEDLVEACKEALKYCRLIPEYVDRSVHKSIPITTLEQALAKAGVKS